MDKKEEHILLKTTSIIKMCNENKKILSSATCFFCRNKEGTLYFVTNNHVIEDSNYCYLYLTFVDEKTKIPYHEYVFCNLQNHIIKHTQYDLCIVDITHIYEKLISEGKKPIISHVPIEKIKTTFNEFNHIEEIYMVGYPNELMSNDINYPIVRKGITATGLCDTINNEDIFIIDIPVYGGSSGSPIYHLTKDGKIILVGITAKKYYEKNYVYKKDKGIIEEDKTEFVKVPNGLGYTIKANVILELLNSQRG